MNKKEQTKELLEIADELEGISTQIREFVRREHPVLPMSWDVQEFYERYKALVTSM